MRILCCGDRDWTDRAFIGTVLTWLLDEFGYDVTVIEGEARGADRICRDEAHALGVPVLPFPADWDGLGKKAGPVRNAQMLSEGRPDLVVGFHDAILQSKGTKDMLEKAQRKGVPARLYLHWRERYAVCLRILPKPARPSRTRPSLWSGGLHT